MDASLSNKTALKPDLGALNANDDLMVKGRAFPRGIRRKLLDLCIAMEEEGYSIESVRVKRI